jgi:hypothetical protein
MIKYAEVELANFQSAREAGAAAPDQWETREFYQKHTHNLVKRFKPAAALI